MTTSARQTIRTTYHGPTNTRGARIKATCARGSITIPFPYELDGNDGHVAAARALILKFGLEWGPSFAVGGDDRGLIFTPVDTANTVSL